MGRCTTDSLRGALVSLAAAAFVGCPAPRSLPPGATALPPCEDPAPAPGALRDVTENSGIDFVHAQWSGDLGVDPLMDDIVRSFGGGLAAGDLDGDTHVDLFFASHDGNNALYFGLGDGRFERAGDESGVAFPGALAMGASTADWDGDGRLDLAISELHRTRFLHNEGGRRFADWTDTLSVPGSDGLGTTLSLADLDGDGDLDLHAGYLFLDAVID
jgi:hypothetical protein